MVEEVTEVTVEVPVERIVEKIIEVEEIETGPPPHPRPIPKDRTRVATDPPHLPSHAIPFYFEPQSSPRIQV